MNVLYSYVPLSISKHASNIINGCMIFHCHKVT